MKICVRSGIECIELIELIVKDDQPDGPLAQYIYTVEPRNKVEGSEDSLVIYNLEFQQHTIGLWYDLYGKPILAYARNVATCFRRPLGSGDQNRRLVYILQYTFVRLYSSVLG
jgi:hypothetical protein